jgi:dihydrodiol dehydrogenase / D-xylose 1-dehydrogenase (NADP)
MQEIGWGILGPGRIATLTTQGPLMNLPGVRRAAVGSRDAARAAAFAERFGFGRSHGSYEELARDPEVEIVYVATPHPWHKEHTILCLEQGKHVLCEKPLAMNAREVREMIACARANGRYLAEAFFPYWTPMLRQVRRWIVEGRIGEVRMLWASCGGRSKLDPANRLFDKALGGGALLDIGCYAVSLVHQLLGAPEQVLASGALGETGVDEQEAMILRYRGGKLAVLSSAIRTAQRNDAVIQGTEGRITMLPAWWGGPRTAILTVGQEETHYQDTEADQLYVGPHGSHEKSWMIADVMQDLAAGRLESAVMPLELSLGIVQTMDAIRAQLGLRYAADEAD